ncbi:MAG: peptidoglycan-binding protein [Bacteroidetes bacterium]|nr:peptidoglycan-binding protein [Bacteroidota bacterium]
MKKNISNTTKKGKGKKWLFIGLGIAGTGVLSYFGWQYWKKKKAQAADNDNYANTPDVSAKTVSANTAAKPKAKTTTQATDGFPLKKGSKGVNVKLLQEALIAKYGKDSLPKYGADGDFGSETVAALKKAGLPESIDESTFNVLTKGSSPDPVQTAEQLYTAANKKDFNKVISLLKTLRNTNDYQAVSNAFMNHRIGGVRQTLVNGILNSFSDEQQKQAIRLAFSNMGLKYNGDKWSLSGLENEKLLITTRPTKVWKNPKEFVNVPANMVLGKEVARRGKHTLFEQDKHFFLTESAHISYYKE